MSLKTDDSGFTLIELLLATVIVGVIMAALGSSVISIVKNSNTTTIRLSESHDAQIAAAYLANDVQSADAPAPSTDTQCDNGHTPVKTAGGSGALRFAWTEYDKTTGNVAFYNLAVYSIVPPIVPGGPSVLRRSYCRGTNSASAPLVSDVVISHNLNTASYAVASCTVGLSQTATLSVAEQSGYTVALSGTRRETTC